MNSRLSLLAGAGLVLFAPSLLPADDAPVPAVLPANPARPEQPRLNDEQLNELVGPVALHPDALVALILPAATAPSDIVLAARYLSAGGLIAKIDEQSWDDSVKALARYPDIVQWMDENLAWTKQLGEVFDNQPADVMKAIQRMRAKARALGHLTDTPQQRVEVVDNLIRIVPVEREVIYVPYYDPAVVYIEAPYRYGNPFLTFSAGFATGYWLAYDFDWGVNTIWVINVRDRERCWNDRRDWRYWHPVVHADRPRYAPPPDCHEWRPSNNDRRHDHPRRPGEVAYSPGPNASYRPAPTFVAGPGNSVGAPRAGDRRDGDRRYDGNRNGSERRFEGNRGQPKPGDVSTNRPPAGDSRRDSTPKTPRTNNDTMILGPSNPAPAVTTLPTNPAQPTEPKVASREVPRYTPKSSPQHTPKAPNLPSTSSSTSQPAQPAQPSQPAQPAVADKAREWRPHMPVNSQPTRTVNTPPASDSASRNSQPSEPARTYTNPRTSTTYTPPPQPRSEPRSYSPPPSSSSSDSSRSYSPPRESHRDSSSSDSSRSYSPPPSHDRSSSSSSSSSSSGSSSSSSSSAPRNDPPPASSGRSDNQQRDQN